MEHGLESTIFPLLSPALTRTRCCLAPAGLFLQENLKYDQFGQLMEGVAASNVLASSPSAFLAYLEVRHPLHA